MPCSGAGEPVNGSVRSVPLEMAVNRRGTTPISGERIFVNLIGMAIEIDCVDVLRITIPMVQVFMADLSLAAALVQY